MKISPCLILSIALLFAGAAPAQKATRPNPPGPLPVDDPNKPAIVLLGDDDFETRHRAEADLPGIGLRAADEIQLALNSGDPEIAFRADRLAKVLNITATDAPLGVLRAARITRILERADNEAANRLLRELAVDRFGSHFSLAANATRARMGKNYRLIPCGEASNPDAARGEEMFKISQFFRESLKTGESELRMIRLPFSVAPQRPHP